MAQKQSGLDLQQATQPYLVRSRLRFVSQASCSQTCSLLVLALFQRLVVVSNKSFLAEFDLFLKNLILF